MTDFAPIEVPVPGDAPEAFGFAPCAGGVCAAEWIENVVDALPEDTLWVDIARGSGENDRIITITGGETH